MREKKMTIVTRTKNRNLLLERSIKSIQAQTSNEYVHVILNDGGDQAAVEKLLKNYPDQTRIVLHNRTSVGHTAALNQAIRATKSQYISILDDDDTWAPQRVAIVNKFMDEHSSNGSVIIMDRIVEEVKGHSIKEISRNRWLEGVSEVSLYEQCLHNYLSNGSFSFTREVYEELGGYDESLGVAEDWDFGIRYLLKYDADFISTKMPLTFYHHRPDQTGEIGNSVFAGADHHAKNLNYLRNKYLREDIAKGRLGIGYIMNDLIHSLHKEQEQEQKALERVVRLEGHINYTSDRLAERLLQQIDKLLSRHNLLRQIKRRLRS